MKYIKKFENDKINQYQDGDYILLDIDEIKKSNDFSSSYYETIDDMARIINFEDNFGVYAIEFYNGINNDFYHVTENEIKRKLTPEEIENFKLKKATYQYGL